MILFFLEASSDEDHTAKMDAIIKNEAQLTQVNGQTLTAIKKLVEDKKTTAAELATLREKLAQSEAVQVAIKAALEVAKKESTDATAALQALQASFAKTTEDGVITATEIAELKTRMTKTTVEQAEAKAALEKATAAQDAESKRLTEAKDEEIETLKTTHAAEIATKEKTINELKAENTALDTANKRCATMMQALLEATKS